MELTVKYSIRHNHVCFCGLEDAPHATGSGKCVRFMCDPPELKPHETLDYPYKQQRGYYQHSCGCWLRWPGSINSLDEE